MSMKIEIVERVAYLERVVAKLLDALTGGHPGIYALRAMYSPDANVAQGQNMSRDPTYWNPDSKSETVRTLIELLSRIPDEYMDAVVLTTSEGGCVHEAISGIESICSERVILGEPFGCDSIPRRLA